MFFPEPMPYEQALKALAARQLLPTTLRTAGLDKLVAAITERGLFSAGVTDFELLRRLHAAITTLVNGEGDLATQRLAIKQYLDSIGYQPGFGETGTILDLSSDLRINLQIETGVELAQGFGAWQQGQDPAVLDLWPAQELFRAEHRDAPRPWAKIWQDAGGRSFGGRMIALKNTPIWVKISRFKQPYPPFDYNSGMDIQDVTRQEAMRYGLIDRDTQIQPERREFNAGLQAAPGPADDSLRQALESTGLGKFNEDGVFVAARRAA
jgi:hypothetical protein